MRLLGAKSYAFFSNFLGKSRIVADTGALTVAVFLSPNSTKTMLPAVCLLLLG